MTINEFNPYNHLSASRQLTAAEAADLLNELAPDERAAIDNGGYVTRGSATRYWSPERQQEARRRQQFYQDWC